MLFYWSVEFFWRNISIAQDWYPLTRVFSTQLNYLFHFQYKQIASKILKKSKLYSSKATLRINWNAPFVSELPCLQSCNAETGILFAIIVDTKSGNLDTKDSLIFRWVLQCFKIHMIQRRRKLWKLGGRHLDLWKTGGRNLEIDLENHFFVGKMDKIC